MEEGDVTEGEQALVEEEGGASGRGRTQSRALRTDPGGIEGEGLEVLIVRVCEDDSLENGFVLLLLGLALLGLRLGWHGVWIWWSLAVRERRAFATASSTRLYSFAPL